MERGTVFNGDPLCAAAAAPPAGKVPIMAFRRSERRSGGASSCASLSVILVYRTFVANLCGLFEQFENPSHHFRPFVGGCRAFPPVPTQAGHASAKKGPCTESAGALEVLGILPADA